MKIDELSGLLASVQKIRTETSAAYQKAIKKTVSENSFRSDFEEYIDRSKRGLPTGDLNVNQELGKRLTNSSDSLSKMDPKALEKYSGYVSGLSYNKRGRFVAYLSEAIESSEQLLNLKS